MNPNCYYYVEGKCEETLIRTLKEKPALIMEGRVKVFNPIEKVLSRSELLKISAGSVVVFTFDTDVPKTDCLNQNIKILQQYVRKVSIVLLPQVLNLEDELKRCTDIRDVTELTKSKSGKDFKHDFCTLTNCRQVLDAHAINIKQLWSTPVPESFVFLPKNAGKIKK